MSIQLLDPNPGISTRRFGLVRHKFARGEDKVLRIRRQHWVVLIPVVLLLLPVVACFVVAGIYQSVHFTIPAYNTVPARPVTLNYIWVAPLVVGLFLLFAAWYAWLGWWCHYRIITNKSLILLTLPPALVIWKDEDFFPLPHEEAKSVEDKSSLVGRILGFGNVRVGTNMQGQEDEKVNDIRLIPGHTDFGQVLRDCRDMVKKVVPNSPSETADKKPRRVHLLCSDRSSSTRGHG
ncbi:hypothetical protein H0X09_00370 [Candidatus Saccharibacteria bacterium]|nr:hypothetical protein [Candidatus Saccharibacteria bacterium]